MRTELTPRRKALSLKLWCAILFVWTLLLITPGNWFPGGASAHSMGGIGLGKLLHVGAYAFLAGSAGWLPATMRWRNVISFALIIHGGLTELTQTIVPFREGCLKDVGIDTFAVLMGWLIARRSWPT